MVVTSGAGVGEAPWPPLGVAGRAVIGRGDGRILLVQRASNVSSDAGMWELPGGKMDVGETLADALRREVSEETGLSVRVGEPIHVSHFAKVPFWVTCVTFVCEQVDGELRLSEEHDAFAWVDVSDLDDRPYARTIREQLDSYVTMGRQNRLAPPV